MIIVSLASHSCLVGQCGLFSVAIIVRLGSLVILVGLSLLIGVVSLAILVILGHRSLPIHTSNNCIILLPILPNYQIPPLSCTIDDMYGR